MVFSSPSFLFAFLPLAMALYFAARGMAAKNLILLILSLLFYAWGEPVMVLVMVGSIGFNFTAARAIDGRQGAARLRALWVAIAVNLAALAVFKYADFLVRDADAVLRMVGGPHIGMKRGQIALPLGISFFTFHALSYLIDVYRRRFPANASLRQTALYIAFFPQLIAGPIVRYRSIARRLAFRRHSWGRASAGLRLVVIGLAMKVLAADPLAPLADAVFDHAAAPGSAGPGLLAAWIGTAAYTLQIYFDFAGYSTIAVGLGVVFGFSLPRNFNRPYRSRSITEFWRRWHISLSNWLRDYLYIPLGGNRGGSVRTYFNLLVVMLLGGFWHGASWTFIIWGAIHGSMLAFERLIGKNAAYRWLPGPLRTAITFAIVCIAWVFFRAPSISIAVGYLRAMFGDASALSGQNLIRGDFYNPLGVGVFLIAAALVWQAPRTWKFTQELTVERAWACMILLAISVVTMWSQTSNPFLYFQF